MLKICRYMGSWGSFVNDLPAGWLFQQVDLLRKVRMVIRRFHLLSFRQTKSFFRRRMFSSEDKTKAGDVISEQKYREYIGRTQPQFFKNYEKVISPVDYPMGPFGYGGLQKIAVCLLISFESCIVRRSHYFTLPLSIHVL